MSENSYIWKKTLRHVASSFYAKVLVEMKLMGKKQFSNPFTSKTKVTFYTHIINLAHKYPLHYTKPTRRSQYTLSISFSAQRKTEKVRALSTCKKSSDQKWKVNKDFHAIGFCIVIKVVANAFFLLVFLERLEKCTKKTKRRKSRAVIMKWRKGEREKETHTHKHFEGSCKSRIVVSVRMLLVSVVILWPCAISFLPAIQPSPNKNHLRFRTRAPTTIKSSKYHTYTRSGPRGKWITDFSC